MSTQSTELKPVEQTETAPTALVTLDPNTYVMQVYAPFEARLEAAIKAAEVAEYEIQTTAGLDTAKKLRASFRDIRTQGENERKVRKAPIIEIGKLLDTKYGELEKAIRVHEEKYDAEVKDEETRKEEERAAKIKAEAERQAVLDEKIKHITEAPLRAIGMDAIGTKELIDELSQIVPTSEVYQERYVEAESALRTVIPALENLHAGKVAVEQQQLAAQAQQMEQQRVSSIQQRIAKIKGYVLDAADCDTAAGMESIISMVESISVDASFAEFQADGEQAKANTLSALRRQLRVVKIEEEERAAAVAQEQIVSTSSASPTIQQAALEVTTTGLALVSTSANDEGVSQSVIPTKEVVDDGSTMKLGDIAKLLGFSLTEQFIEELGIKPTGRERNAVLYRCADFPAICERLIANINAASVDFHEQRKAA